MNPCELIESKLICGEALTEPERVHLEACTACAALVQDLQGIEAAGEQLATFGDVEPAEVSALRDGLDASTRSGARMGRLVLAGAGLAACLLVVVAIQWQPDDVSNEAYGDELLALMDDVETITGGEIASVDESEGLENDEAVEGAPLVLLDEVDSLTADEEEADDLLSDLFLQDAEEEGLWSEELKLPGGYQVLSDMLEDRWL